jgi:hypothetical protein
MRSLGLVLRVVPGSRAEVLRVTIVDNAEVIGRTSPRHCFVRVVLCSVC